ncbi:MAG: 30S ribosome-binding factor RbfA [Deltaproteobacteria bacterium]|nr:30S ribosome-binding factor RbfA [Deltaproteobacteria bacterium]
MVNDTRVQKVGDLVKEELAQVFLFHIKDPSLSLLTITYVRMTPDLRIARVYYSVMADDLDKKNAIEKGLSRVKGWLRNWLADHLRLRFVPELEFFYDDSTLYGMRIDSLLAKLKKERGEE